MTWDSDLLPEDKGICALAYVGTHNYDIGVNLAKIVQQIKPKGGTICIQSGGAAAANHNERMQGIRDTLAGKHSAELPGDRLTGQNGWTEVDGCPLYTNDDFPLVGAADGVHPRQVPEARRLRPDRRLPAVRARCLQARRRAKYKDKIAEAASWPWSSPTPCRSRSTCCRKAYSLGQVGQRPFEMGYKSIYYR